MKTTLLLSLLGIMLFTGCDDTTTVGSSLSSSTISTEDENDDDNEEESTPITIYSHNQGASCLSCHAAPANAADGKDFLSGGTVYTKLDGSSSDTYANNYTIRVVLDTGLAINFKDGRGTGNSNSENSALSSNYTFTAQVLDPNGDVVSYSATNSHTTSSNLNCNSCHTASGDNNAPGRITF